MTKIYSIVYEYARVITADDCLNTTYTDVVKSFSTIEKAIAYMDSIEMREKSRTDVHEIKVSRRDETTDENGEPLTFHYVSISISRTADKIIDCNTDYRVCEFYTIIENVLD